MYFFKIVQYIIFLDIREGEMCLLYDDYGGYGFDFDYYDYDYDEYAYDQDYGFENDYDYFDDLDFDFDEDDEDIYYSVLYLVDATMVLCPLLMFGY